jgi:uncharacterized protein YecT (DUF1311 family)
MASQRSQRAWTQSNDAVCVPVFDVDWNAMLGDMNALVCGDVTSDAW